MGTRRSISKSDYRLYARPVSGESGDWVEVVADGGEPPQASSPTTHAEAEFSDAGGGRATADGPFEAAAAPGRSCRIPSLTQGPPQQAQG